jgi:acetoin utilization deacetylase AcuC-like enzyme
MMPVFWSPDYVLAEEDFDTTRKSGWIVDSLKADPILGITIETPPPLTASDLCEIHDADYVRAVQTGRPRSLVGSQGLRWDPGLYTMPCAHTSGLLAAALHAFHSRENAGSLSDGQQHAAYDTGVGFCTFNGIALAAKRVLQAGANRVLVIDLDA